MDNPTRSERTRNAVIQAALAIIARDGPGRLTFDAIARESGLSKGGIMHQFPSKSAVLKALLEHQIHYFEDFSQQRRTKLKAEQSEATLLAEIATLREVIHMPHSVAHAMVAALVEEPELLTISREAAGRNAERIKAEAADPDLALLRWTAARGLLVTAQLGLCPLSDAERERLFDRLSDDSKWTPVVETKKQRPKKSPASTRASGGSKAGKR